MARELRLSLFKALAIQLLLIMAVKQLLIVLCPLSAFGYQKERFAYLFIFACSFICLFSVHLETSYLIRFLCHRDRGGLFLSPSLPQDPEAKQNLSKARTAPSPPFIRGKEENRYALIILCSCSIANHGY